MSEAGDFAQALGCVEHFIFSRLREDAEDERCLSEGFLGRHGRKQRSMRRGITLLTMSGPDGMLIGRAD